MTGLPLEATSREPAPAPARAAGETRPDLRETLAPLLERFSPIATLPVLAASDQGLLGTSRDPLGLCAVAAAEAALERSGDGGWSCPVTSCPHHRHFQCLPVSAAPSPLWLAHCEGSEKLRAFTALAASKLDDARDRDTLLDELSRVYEEINWLYGLGNVLQQGPDQQAIYNEIFAYTRDLLPVSAAQVWVPDKDSEVYRCLLHFDGTQRVKNLETVDRTPATDAQLHHQGIRVLRSGPGTEEHLLAFTGTLGLPAIALPLEHKGDFLGLLLLRLEEVPAPLTAPQLKLLGVIARQTSLCLQVNLLLDELRANEGLKREIEIARQIQHGMLPRAIPHHQSFDLHAGCITAARVGGDYYDFFPEADQLGVLIADVSGHSVASGLIGMSFRSSFRHFLALGVPMDQLFEKVNESIYEELHHSGHFLSAFFCRHSHGRRELRYVNAGHNPPFVYRSATGGFLDLAEASLLIGILPHVGYQVGTLALQRGDVVVLYTDGIVEAENQFRQAFGVERLKDSVRRNATRSAKQMYHYILKEMFLFQDEFFNRDDVTLCLLKVL